MNFFPWKTEIFGDSYIFGYKKIWSYPPASLLRVETNAGQYLLIIIDLMHPQGNAYGSTESKNWLNKASKNTGFLTLKAMMLDCGKTQIEILLNEDGYPLDYLLFSLKALNPLIKSSTIISFLKSSVRSLGYGTYFNGSIKPFTIIICKNNKSAKYISPLTLCEIPSKDKSRVAQITPQAIDPPYSPPEFLNNVNGSTLANLHRADVYMLGLTFLYSILGLPKQDILSIIEIRKADIMHNPLIERLVDMSRQYMESSDYADKLLEVLRLMLKFNPLERPTAMQLYFVLSELPNLGAKEIRSCITLNESDIKLRYYDNAPYENKLTEVKCNVSHTEESKIYTKEISQDLLSITEKMKATMLTVTALEEDIRGDSSLI